MSHDLRAHLEQEIADLIVNHWFIQGGEMQFGAITGSNPDEIVSSILERVRAAVSPPQTPALALLREAVDGLSQGACFTCGAEPGTNIDCEGCDWIARARAALASADPHPAVETPRHDLRRTALELLEACERDFCSLLTDECEDNETVADGIGSDSAQTYITFGMIRRLRAAVSPPQTPETSVNWQQRYQELRDWAEANGWLDKALRVPAVETPRQEEPQ